MLHREDCSEYGNAVDVIADGPLAEGRLAISPHYTVLRRAIGQLGGLLLLYRTASYGRTAEIASSLEGVSAEWRGAVQGLRSITAPPRLRRIHTEVNTAAELIGVAISMLRTSFKAAGGGVTPADAALAPLKRAQRILLAVSDDRFGMTMVSYATACCCSPIINQHKFRGGPTHGKLLNLGA